MTSFEELGLFGILSLNFCWVDRKLKSIDYLISAQVCDLKLEASIDFKYPGLILWSCIKFLTRTQINSDATSHFTCYFEAEPLSGTFLFSFFATRFCAWMHAEYNEWRTPSRFISLTEAYCLNCGFPVWLGTLNSLFQMLWCISEWHWLRQQVHIISICCFCHKVNIRYPFTL